MKQIGSVEIESLHTATLGWKLSTSVAILPTILYNQWHGHEVTIGWLVWGFKIWWPTKKMRERMK